MSLSQKIKRYKKDFEYSYTLGVYPTIELLLHQPDKVEAMFFHSKGIKNQGIQKIKALCNEIGIEPMENDRMVDKLADRGNTYAIGIFRKFGTQLDQKENHLVLVHPSSMGNLGTIMRTMRGFGQNNLALIEPAADAFNPKTIRSSMGGIFQLKVQTFAKFTDYWGSYRNHVIYPLMTNGSTSLPDVIFKKPYALVFGEEKSGLPDDFLQYGTSVKIPTSEAIDSLNLAQSVGISLYHSWIINN